MAGEIKSITSEALEAAYRALTPSQSGFTQDLQASNTIIPVLDLTASAEGTSTPQNMQTALAFGSQTAFNANNSTVTVINTTGFWRIFGNASVMASGFAKFNMTDGLSNKVIYAQGYPTGGGTGTMSMIFDFVVFLASGESITAEATSANVNIGGSVRQIADVNGVLVQPSGFTPQ